MRKNIRNVKSVLILYTKISVYIRTEYKRPKNKSLRRQNIFNTQAGNDF